MTKICFSHDAWSCWCPRNWILSALESSTYVDKHRDKDRSNLLWGSIVTDYNVMDKIASWRVSLHVGQHLRLSISKNQLRFAHLKNGRLVILIGNLPVETNDWFESPWATHKNCASLISGKNVPSRGREPWKMELDAKILTQLWWPWQWSLRYLPMELRLGLR